jgi:DNA-binding response OmpR family regulator
MNFTMENPAPMERTKAVRSSRKKILLADDDAAIRQLLMRLLTEEDYSVSTAANGLEAVELADETKFDLALLDLNMPEKEGWKTFEQLVTKNPALPVIVITARPNQVFSALAAGVAALLEKPLNFVQLFSTIRELLAEPLEQRLARLAGRPALFRHFAPIPDVPGKN